MSTVPGIPEPHSTAWVAQVWLSWLIALGATLLGIVLLPVDLWSRGYLLMGLLFVVGSTLNLAKTTRDLHEARKVHAVINDAKLEKILAEHGPLK